MAAAQQIPLPAGSLRGTGGPGGTVRVAPDLAMRRLFFVNVVFVGQPGAPGWVLVDAGPPGTRRLIERAAASLFGRARPAAILLTHGHFDHVGALAALAERWDVPVWAHAREQPHLDGARAYPPPDPSTGGLMARASPLFPRRPITVGRRLRLLPADGAVPPLPGWEAIETPGHTAGHVSLFRPADRALVAGDAFVTVATERLAGAIGQAPEMHGPPRYFTPDWAEAGRSIARLAALRPELAVTGHGRAVGGPGLREALDRLAARFDTVAKPPDDRLS